MQKCSSHGNILILISKVVIFFLYFKMLQISDNIGFQTLKWIVDKMSLHLRVY